MVSLKRPGLPAGPMGVTEAQPGDVAWQLFETVWRELDFDDHPHHGGHDPIPEGKLEVCSEPGRLRLRDDRMRFYLYTDPARLDAEWRHGAAATALQPDESGRGVSIHVVSSAPRQTRPAPGRLGLHRWSLDAGTIGDDGFQYIREKVGDLYEEASDIALLDNHDALTIDPELSAHETDRPALSVAEWRSLLSHLHHRVAPLLPGWTWHLEVDNKADRTGWYVRAPEAWKSLFTLFIGVGWTPSPTCDDARGFILFERAPPGELDRGDEEEANQLDGLRTVALCNASRGALSHLAGEMQWAMHPEPFRLSELPGNVQLWPPSMGMWPLLFARSTGAVDVLEGDAIADWAACIIEALQPAISTLNAKIDGLSWH